MPKYTKTTVTQLSANEQAALDQINKNFEDIQSAIADTVSRSGAIPSHMTNDLDMNGKRIINVPTPKTENDLVRQKDVVGDIATVQQLVNTTTNAAAQTLEAAQAVQEILEDTHVGLVADDLALGEDSNIVQVANNKTNIDTVAGSISNVDAVGSNISSVINVDENETNINIVAGNSSDISTVAESISDVNAIGPAIEDVSTVADSISNVSTVADSISDINDVAADLENIDAASGYASEAKQWAIGDPTEPSGNSAKWWAEHSGLPDQSGQAGKVLMTDGTGTYWGQSAADGDGITINTNSLGKTQAIGVIDQASSTRAIKTWTGLTANVPATPDANTIYNITDDNVNYLQNLLETLYPVGCLYFGTTPVCPMAALLGTWTLVGTKLVTNVDSTAGVKGNGMALGMTDGTDYGGAYRSPMTSLSGSALLLYDKGSYGSEIGQTATQDRTWGSSFTTAGLTQDPTKSGIEATVTSSSLTINVWQRSA